MAAEKRCPNTENASAPAAGERRMSAAEYLISARGLSQQIVDRGCRQAEEIVGRAKAEAAEIVARARQEADSILAEAWRDAERVRSQSEQNAALAAPEDQEQTVRRVEACFDRLRQQHLDAIDRLNQEWQEFLCSLYAGEETEEVPPDLSERVSAIADAMEGFGEEN